jgi:16S rRNA processing protein RimM
LIYEQMKNEPVSIETQSSEHGIEQVQIGRFGAAYGLKGWVKVISFTDPTDQIIAYLPWQIRKGKQKLQLQIEQCKSQGKGCVALVEGFSDRNQAESVVGYEIWIDRARLPELDQGEFYWHQLEGLEVVSQSGENLGQVDHLMETGANDVLVVKSTLESIDDRERLIPFVEGDVISHVDFESARIVVDWNKDY